MAKQNKTCSFEYEIIEHLKKAQPSASEYIEDLIYADIKRCQDLKKPMGDLNQLCIDSEAQIKEKEQKELERKERQEAWERLPFDIKEEIQSYANWGEKWKRIFYPIWKAKGTITKDDFRQVV